jgi:hypothetical protein
MKDLIVLLMHLLTPLAKLMGPVGAKAVVADSLLNGHFSTNAVSAFAPACA